MSPYLRPHLALAAAATAAAAMLSGCAQDPREPGPASGAPAASAPSDQTLPSTPGSEPTGIAPATPAGPPPATATDEHMTQLLQLHAQLKTTLGSAYSDAWIEGGQLHVAVTTPEAEAAVLEAGAVPARAEFTEQQLQDAAQAFKAWLATDAAPPVQLRWLGTSGRTASITVRVPPEQVQPLTDAITEQQPTGAVKVTVEPGEPILPFSTNAP